MTQPSSKARYGHIHCGHQPLYVTPPYTGGLDYERKKTRSERSFQRGVRCIFHEEHTYIVLRFSSEGPGDPTRRWVRSSEPEIPHPRVILLAAIIGHQPCALQPHTFTVRFTAFAFLKNICKSWRLSSCSRCELGMQSSERTQPASRGSNNPRSRYCYRTYRVRSILALARANLFCHPCASIDGRRLEQTKPA